MVGGRGEGGRLVKLLVGISAIDSVVALDDDALTQAIIWLGFDYLSPTEHQMQPSVKQDRPGKVVTP